jgi:transcriptional regulator with XRE-family HTH domain
MEKAFHKSLTKKELAQRLNVSSATLRRYLNDKYYPKLERYDYEKRVRILTPRILNYLAEVFDISEKS